MFVRKGIFRTLLWIIWSCSGIYSECHYDFRLSKTKCTHHDGSVWISGVPEEQVSKNDLAHAANSKLELKSSSHNIISSLHTKKQSALEKGTEAAVLTMGSNMDPAVDKSSKLQSSRSFWDPIKRRYSRQPRGGDKSEENQDAETQSPYTTAATASSSESLPSKPQSKSLKGSPWVASCFDKQCPFPWVDSKRRRIEAHGGGMIQVANGTFYWYGESQKQIDKSRGYGYSLGVNCYSSVNLGGPWVYEGMVLSQNSIWVKELNDEDRPFIIERPKVLYNEKTDRYVMWFHLDAASDRQTSSSSWRERRKLSRSSNKTSTLVSTTVDSNEDGYVKGRLGSGESGGVEVNRRLRRLSHRHKYWFRHAGVAMSSSPTGPFRFIHAIQPDNLPSLDLQLFGDKNGAAYLIRSVNNEYVGMSRLSDDYLSTRADQGILSTIRPCLEGMAVFRNPNDNVLYAIMSHLTGWEPNPLVLLRAHRVTASGERGALCGDDCTLEDKIQWADLGNPSHHPKSFNQQPTYVMTLHDRHQKPYVMLMSDNWLYAGYRGLPDAGYIWLPLEFRHESTVGIRKMKNWTLDAPFDRRHD